MNIGRLRDRVTIQTLKQTRDITGEILETWVDGHTLWASVNMISSKEAISSGCRTGDWNGKDMDTLQEGHQRHQPDKGQYGAAGGACTEYHRAAAAGCRQDTP
ncbi:head-tail adaptor [Escherichia coli]|uniref:Head-tail adaptor n=1 Tax=Escherichia coli TaxID=562 RepID=A0A447XYU4_ECOLX|nr:head-tail adaptor [Escherichia coli]